MNKLEPLHEQAINLFVSGKRQNEIATILNINPRTLRRWSESELFINELTRQHDQALNLERDARARAIRQRHDTHQLAMTQIAGLLKDPQTPTDLRVQCLRIVIQDQHNEIRQNDTVAFRDRIYEDKLADKKQKEEEKRQTHENMLKHMASLKAANNVVANLAQQSEERLARRLAELDQIEADQLAQENADKSGQPVSIAGVPPASSSAPTSCGQDGRDTADKTGQAVRGPGVPPGPKSDAPTPTQPTASTPEPDKSGQTVSIAGVPPASSSATTPCGRDGRDTPDKSGHVPMKTPPIVQPVKPFRYPPTIKDPDTKADKTARS